MTFKDLENLIITNSIPKNVKLMSDSGWECSETEMDGVWYNRELNTIIFTQGDYMKCDHWSDEEGWVALHGDMKSVEED